MIELLQKLIRIKYISPSDMGCFDLIENELKKLKIAIVDVLKKSIGAGGTTFSDFRDLEGDNGNFGLQTNVYRRTGKECRKCKNIVERQKISGRSTHWCSKCQK